MINDFCNKCGACCKNIKADMEKNILFWDGELPLTEEFKSMLIPVNNNIYTCRFLENNLCTNPSKPDICTNYPSSPFVELPDNCHYCGLIFMKREKIQQKIRKLKEEIIHYNTLIETTKDKREQNQFQRIIASHQKQVDKYKEYGSKDW